uniref:Penicillin-binding protein 2 n=1 Tax=candidate division WOR-3 bacterium TaxID=2052148 RepID=A0A7C4CAX0_UNCW3
MADKLTRIGQTVLLLFAILGLRLTQLQVVRGERYARLSDRNRIRRILLPAPRGRIFDRNGILIADSRPSFTVTVIPTELPDSALPVLAGLLAIQPDDLKRQLEPVARVPGPVPLRRDVDLTTVARIEENNFRLPGVLIRVDPVRNYPKGWRYCHVVGHLGEISEEELKADSSYRRLDYVGRAGIEARYEKRLRGRDGYQYAEVDARGRAIGPLPEKRPEPAVPGCDLHLTLDDRLQNLASRLVAGYERAAVVGMEIRTGAILCLVSQPGFDPNIFISPIDAATWDAIVSNPSKPFYNRAVTSTYPPGSTLKPIVALAALRQRLVSPRTTLDPCVGKVRYGNRDFKCWSVHGRVNLLEAIAQSCNVYFYQLGLRLGLDSLTAYCRSVGLGARTGIDLPAEGEGNIPDRRWLDVRYGKGKWTSGVVLNFAIGQGEITVTPLQLCLAYAAIAGDGVCGHPHIVARIDSAGRTVPRSAYPVRELKLDQNDLKQVRLAMTRVVEHGTGRAARLGEITIAGKTGTAQNPPRPDHAWFVGYAPADAPEVVFAVIVENAGHGGTVAAPIVAKLVRAWSAARAGIDTSEPASESLFGQPATESLSSSRSRQP